MWRRFPARSRGDGQIEGRHDVRRLRVGHPAQRVVRGEHCARAAGGREEAGDTRRVGRDGALEPGAADVLGVPASGLVGADDQCQPQVQHRERVDPDRGDPAEDRPGSAPKGTARRPPRVSKGGGSEVLRPRTPASAAAASGGSGGPPADVAATLARPSRNAGVVAVELAAAGVEPETSSRPGTAAAPANPVHAAARRHGGPLALRTCTAPAKPRWLLAIPDAISQLEQLDRQLLNRRDIERSLRRRQGARRRAHEDLRAELVGNQRTLPRTRLLQQVPMSISAVTGADIERRAIDNLTELARWTPGLTVVDQGARGSNAVIVRGLNTDSLNGSEFTGNNYNKEVSPGALLAHMVPYSPKNGGCRDAQEPVDSLSDSLTS